MKKILSLTLAFLMILVVFAGCKASPSSTSTTTTKGTTSAVTTGSGTTAVTTKAPAKQLEYFAFGLWAGAFDLKCFASPQAGREQLLNQIWPRLIYLKTYGGKLKDAEMWLAKKVTKVDDITYDVELYDYIYDRKGNHITAEDVKWSYEMAPENGITEVQSVLGSIEIKNDYNLRFKLNSPGDGKIEVLLGFHRMTICDKEWYMKASAEERVINAATAAAYYVKEYVQGSKVVLEANDKYWQKDKSLLGLSGQQNVKTFYGRVIPEAPVRGIALEKGEVDYTTVTIPILPNFVEKNGKAKSGYVFSPQGGATCNVIFMNMDEQSSSPVAKSLDLRLAILKAIDVEGLRSAAGLDATNSWICNDFGTPAMAGYNKDWDNTYIKYDPAAAKEHLKKAGYPNGLTLRFMYAGGTTTNTTIITENLKAIGITVTQMPYDQALFNTYKYDSSKWDIELEYKGGYSLIDDWYNMFSPTGYKNGGANFCKDQTLYDLLNKTVLSGDQKDIDATHNRMMELAMGRGLFAPTTLHVARAGIINMPFNNYLMPMINAWTFEENYKSKAIIK